MNRNAKRWVQALRSGEFPQTENALRTKAGFCCLGVACELAARSKVIPPVRLSKDSQNFSYDGRRGLLPGAVRDWLGLSTSSGCFIRRGKTTELTELNDGGQSFKQIARLIESEPKELFKPKKVSKKS